MNDLAAHETVENVHRMALGIELIDGFRRKEPSHPIRIDIERGLPHIPRPSENQCCCIHGVKKTPETLCRHFSGRYALLYYPSIQKQIVVRIYDRRRWFIPRRLSVPLLTEEAVKAIEKAEQRNYHVGRVRRPVMFPGAAYDVQAAATGLRGRVLRDGNPMRPVRWSWVEGRLPASGELVGRARGDDRGEFLLLLAPTAAPASDLNATIEVQIAISAPAVVADPPTPQTPKKDPLWDVPLEQLPAPGEDDDVSDGSSFPLGYVSALSSVRIVSFRVGRVLTGTEEDDFVFSI